MGIVWCILLYGGVLVCCEGLGANLISRLQDSVTTSQSSIYLGYDSPNAIDGSDSQLIHACQCCSVTNGAIPSWWQINLGNKYLIDALDVFGRQDTRYTDQLQDADIYAGNVSLAGNNTNGVKVYTIPTIINDYPSDFIKYLQPAIIARYFIITLQQKILTICEFKLYEKHCGVGKFGTGCSHQCHCLDKNTCNSVTGRCHTTGCLDGWQGSACDTLCGHGTFGHNCLSACHCKNAADCQHNTGFCSDGCAPGWRGQSCDTVCGHGTFGYSCSIECYCKDDTACDPTTGFCSDGCAPGRRGQSCDTVCGHGTFGYNCSSECHCKDAADCEHNTGFCSDGCALGWRGQSCDTVCGQGTFGYNCSSECYCKDAADCEPKEGNCSDGCAPGWQEQSCDTDTNLIRHVYGQVTTQMSSVAHNWSSDLAIDGREGPDPTKCQCCSVTTNAEVSWWRLDLGSIFPIKAVTIYGSNQESIYQRLQGFQMYLSNKTDHNLPAVYIDNNNIPVDNTYIIKLPDTLTRYVTIRRPGVLTLCEITLLEGEHIDTGNTEQKGTGDTGENETGSTINVTSAIIGASVGVALSLACAVSIGIIVWKYRTSKRTESKNEYTRPDHSGAPSEVPHYDTLDYCQDTSTPRSNVYINERITGL